ncbi:agmatine deiminase family protein [Pseudoalteromonas sp. MMG013]|uniref:agmatine deiminase family protein n=1 Tax=unclassified Pseudoalteromonas TaxID=194690 RepID=UPI001B36E05F|nr:MULTISPECIES: agmatine deiminase family protein [unclassified Pseudoalteromonas]MBQ4847641.1 agmatine deiminase family protein [Pseudoalteromonas sp. MMG005]MBQ4864669.1 agmatine deiminase family protein [Pseudoalteromonas sp. MMG013]
MSFRLLPEWAPQDAIMLTWPHKNTDWVNILSDVEPVYVTLCQQISQVQKILIVAHTPALKQHITTLLNNASIDLGNIVFVIAPCNDTWARDHGPITVANKQGKLKVKDFTFNGWGNKYEAQLDNKLNTAIATQAMSEHIQFDSINFVLEGGGIEINEHGTLLTTSACLLNPNRNPEFSKEQVEYTLSQELGAEAFLWVEHGYLAGDDTDSHIDTLVRFAPNNTIVYVTCDDINDEHYVELANMQRQLASFTTPSGSKYNIVPLPWPKAIYNDEKERLPATYANYLILNNTVLVPIYGDDNDSLAISQIQSAYPQHTVIGIDCLPIIHQFGSLHCITMQLPRGFLQQE